MATATKTTDQQPNPFATIAFPEPDENLVALTKKVAGAYIDSYEKVGLSVADYQEETAKASNLAWVEVAGAAQADVMRQLTKLYVSTARDLVK